MKQGYIVFDFGTGNMRVAVIETNGTILAIEREDIHYQSNPEFAQSLYFDPEQIWSRLVTLARNALARSGDVRIIGATSTSQRQGIVLIDRNGRPFLGLPNIDFRGEDYSKQMPNRQAIYEKTARWPTGLFSGMSLAFIRTYEPEVWERIDKFCSISDWMVYMLSGKLGYEPSQATETLLYDVRLNEWSEALAQEMNLTTSILPPIHPSGTVLGNLLPEMSALFGLEQDVKVIVGGADTQVAVKHVTSSVGDAIIVSGTTTPIVKIVDRFLYDSHARTWTNSHIEPGKWLIEGNCGVSGLNYQKIKAIFYPNESYETMEEEMSRVNHYDCFACLSTSPIDGVQPQHGGFVFPIPTPQHLTRAHFAWAALFDIACAIKTIWGQVEDIVRDTGFIWGCGGGFQSATLSGMLADMLDAEIRVKRNGQHSSVLGSVLICNETLGIPGGTDFNDYESVLPDKKTDYQQLYEDWLQCRKIIDQKTYIKGASND
ncbi:FGGY-family carbohydrate kinase [Paenibacillus sp. GCM10027626]|uniref:FGGY-family carbohydrate kinase n=1 Tax=Paenibacillus sp. GCM10027626 TaxID=3273411 RepID=UPI00362DEBE8